MSGSAQFQQACVLIEQSRYDLAAAKLREVIGIEPDADNAHAMLALCLMNLDRLADAEEAARRAVELCPTESFNHYALAMALTRRNKGRQALAAANAAVELDASSSLSWFGLAAVHHRENRLKEAIEAAERGLALDPDDVELQSIRNSSLARLGAAGAPDEAREALARDPENAWAHDNMGWALLNTGDHRQAITHFRESLRIDPTFDHSKEGLLEALKARSWVYRPVLKYRSLCRKYKASTQLWFWVGLVGALYLSRKLGTQFPGVTPYMHLIRGCVYAAAFFLMFSDPLVNLVLRVDPDGKHVLTRRQSRFAVALGILILPMLTGMIGAALTESVHWKRLEMVFLPLCAAVVIIGDVDNRRQQKIGAAFLALATVAAVAMLINYFVVPLGLGAHLRIYLNGALLGALAIWFWDFFRVKDE